MTTLYILDIFAELIELTYDLGAATRKYAVPALIAVFVAASMAVEYVRGYMPMSRAKMTQEILKEFEKISMMDPVTRGSDVPEAAQWLESLSDEELKAEYQAM